MAFRDSPWQALKAPLTWAAAAVAVIAAGVALALLLTDRQASNTSAGYGGARSEFDEMLEPVAGVVAAPLRWASSMGDFSGGYFFAVSQNRALKRRLVEMQRWQDQAIALQNLTHRYEQLLKLRTDPPINMVSAHIVTDVRGPFANARLANAGSAQGVKVGNPAMSEHGVIGRVIGVTKNVSRILLLTDIESRTPVLIERTDARAVLTGDGGSNPKLEFVRGQNVVKDGDIVLTSGDGGLYPRGLPVGVAARDFRGVWRLRLYSDRAPIDFIRILLFDDFAQSVDQAALNDAAMPPLSAADRAQVAAQTTAQAAPPPSSPAWTTASPAAKPGAAGAVPTGTIPSSSKPKTKSDHAPKQPAPHEYRRVHVQTAPDEQGYPQYQGPPVSGDEPQAGR